MTLSFKKKNPAKNLFGDFNGWCIKDKTTYKGTKHELLTAKFSLNEIINKPSSCTDLLCVSEPKVET